LYLPVPTIRRERNCLPASRKESVIVLIVRLDLRLIISGGKLREE
jgi:hypothetical protein